MTNSKYLAPIALFVFNRPYHTRKTIDALLQNPEAKYSTLFIYSDGPRNIDDEMAVNEVRTYIRSLDGFADIQIINRDRNIGLAESIIQGVTNLCRQYGRVIVMEDDLVTSPAFLSFMNQALDTYQAEKKVWHISGWNYPIAAKALEPYFLWRTMNCWGWATWADRWQHFSKDSERLIQTWKKSDIKRFNLDGAYDFWKQVTLNQKGKLNTWAIFWYATIFEHDGLCLNPIHSYVTNIGHDGSGVNCRKSNVFLTEKDLNQNMEIQRVNVQSESKLHVNQIKRILRKEFSLYSRVKRRIFQQ